MGFESVKFSELAVGDDLEFWIVTERRKSPGSAPAIWEIVQKKRAIAKYHGTKRVNGENRPLVKLWIKYPGAKPVPLIVNLNSRNKRERMLLGEDFTDGKLVDTELTFGDAW
ncbi:hypothetical protein RSSM_03228 [Rhodopirellula sallentina SM41]|uniref:Uncharacterized protein n=1 Tax=Rhodopirellula sallentina SM41 TaxID=1263870 RepID=M5U1I9_9BACT|nr:hypothetical protein RSSM_03228 [Rhodopirellula sallentina SM41]